eukprot:m51a1_g13103 hypothetical protein (133) ;mRNA; f:1568-2059
MLKTKAKSGFFEFNLLEMTAVHGVQDKDAATNPSAFARRYIAEYRSRENKARKLHLRQPFQKLVAQRTVEAMQLPHNPWPQSRLWISRKPRAHPSNAMRRRSARRSHCRLWLRRRKWPRWALQGWPRTRTIS